MSATHRLLLVVCAVVFFSGATSVAHAQNERQIGADFMTLFPKGEFKENIENNGYGGAFNFMHSIGSSPFFVGGDFGIGRYGSVSREEVLTPTIPEVFVKVQTDNNIYTSHFVLRLQPRTGKIRPYIDGLVGFKYLTTVTKIIDEDDIDDPVIASTQNFSDSALSYGVGGGVQVRLTGNERKGVFFDSKVRWLRGGHAEYLREGSIVLVPDGVIYDVFASRTDAISLNFGIGFRF